MWHHTCTHANNFRPYEPPLGVYDDLLMQCWCTFLLTRTDVARNRLFSRSCMNTEDENELSVGARYLLAFKAKAGRDGLTLQARIL